MIAKLRFGKIAWPIGPGRDPRTVKKKLQA